MRFAFDPRQPIVLPAVVFGPDGDIRVRLLLDTGATTTMIRPPRLTEVGIDVKSSERRSITTASGMVTIPVVPIGGLRVGDIFRPELTVLAHELPPSAEIDGLLGMDFLKGLHLSLKMRSGILTLEAEA